MIFAIYRGTLNDKEFDGIFTKGKLYLMTAGVYDAVDVHHLRLKDDDGEKVCIDPDKDDRFEYPDEVYGVVLNQLGTKNAGEVVIIDDAGDDGYLSIKETGFGFVRAENIQLLDSTVVTPRMIVYDKEQRRWSRIRQINGRMNIQVEGSEDFRSCNNFIFSVSDRELTTIPLLRCLDDTGQDNIQLNLIYRVKGLDDDGFIIIEDDTGEEASFDPSRFEFV
jgi:hypothetical protein